MIYYWIYKALAQTVWLYFNFFFFSREKQKGELFYLMLPHWDERPRGSVTPLPSGDVGLGRARAAHAVLSSIDCLRLGPSFSCWTVCLNAKLFPRDSKPSVWPSVRFLEEFQYIFIFKWSCDVISVNISMESNNSNILWITLKIMTWLYDRSQKMRLGRWLSKVFVGQIWALCLDPSTQGESQVQLCMPAILRLGQQRYGVPVAERPDSSVVSIRCRAVEEDTGHGPPHVYKHICMHINNT